MNYTIPVIFSMALFTLVSCGEQETSVTSNAYFNIEGFFKNEAARLQKSNAALTKTASQNQHSETVNLKIANWANELELFSESAINKPAWKDSYKVKQSKNTTTYTSTDDKLRTQKINVEKSIDGKVKHIQIFNSSKNSLYSSLEELDYFPDSLYSIKKKQDVLFLGTNNYFISGKF